jgi:CRP/FNR family transcriptional regulator, dissimilatory nitrate respiration regulator
LFADRVFSADYKMNKSISDEILKALKACHLFNGLKKAELENIAELCDLRTLDKGQILFSEGEHAQSFFILIKGRMRVYKLAASGREQILVTPEPVTTFAEAALFADQRYPAYCSASEDSEIFVIDKTRFLRLIESRPQIALNMIALMAERLRGFSHKIEQLSLMGVVPRLAEYLDAQSDGKTEFSLEISKSDLASYLGTVPETLSRAFAKLKSNEIIEEIGTRIHIKDILALKEIASSFD